MRQDTGVGAVKGRKSSITHESMWGSAQGSMREELLDNRPVCGGAAKVRGGGVGLGLWEGMMCRTGPVGGGVGLGLLMGEELLDNRRVCGGSSQE